MALLKRSYKKTPPKPTVFSCTYCSEDVEITYPQKMRTTKIYCNKVCQLKYYSLIGVNIKLDKARLLYRVSRRLRVDDRKIRNLLKHNAIVEGITGHLFLSDLGEDLLARAFDKFGNKIKATPTKK